MYEVVTTVLNPFCFLQLLGIVIVIMLWSRVRTSRGWLAGLTFCIAALFLLSLPAVGYLALGSLEWQNPRTQNLPPFDAIVVLGGSAWPSDEQTGGIQLGRSTILRLQAAAEVYRRVAPTTVITCGGQISHTAPQLRLAHAMREALLRDGVAEADVLTESHSRNTYENAVFAARLCRQKSIKTVALLTEGTHLPRAIGCFQRQYLTAVPVGCDYRANEFPWELRSFLPSYTGVEATDRALHEWIGIVFYRMLGRM